MIRISAVILILFITSCTTTHVLRIDGEKKFEASNTSIGWDREDISLGLKKGEKETELMIGVGSSSGSPGLNRAISAVEKTLEDLKEMRP